MLRDQHRGVGHGFLRLENLGRKLIANATGLPVLGEHYVPITVAIDCFWCEYINLVG